ncbi:MAG TPA: hypothetical protein VGM98_00955 [Schlesneria sp.]
MTRVFFLLAMLGAVSVVADETPPELDPTIDSAEEFEARTKPLIAGIRNSSSLVVYEGLPHQMWEQEALEKELKTKKTLKRHGFPFYETPIKVKKEVAAKLTATCGDLKNFERWSGDKLCGGYHPDWCVEFQEGTNVYHVLICFGCSEARFYGSKRAVYSDLTNVSKEKFEEMLKPLRKERPARD